MLSSIPMQSSARRRATYEDLCQAAENLVAELIDGELFTSPRPASPHALATSAISQDLSPFSRRPGQPDAPGGWWILYEPELHFGDDVLVPDVAGWRRERMPAIPSVPFFELAPDWVCEVVSPSTGRLDRVKKMPLYARAGVAHLWLVDPLNRTLEVYRQEAEHWLVVATYGGEEVVSPEPFSAIPIELARWWLETAV
jgi:Uma2 family endonuclease